MKFRGFPINKVRNALGGPFLIVEWETVVNVGRFTENDGKYEWDGRHIEIVKPYVDLRGDQHSASLSLRSNAAETVEDLAYYIALLNTVQSVMVDLNDQITFREAE